MPAPLGKVGVAIVKGLLMDEDLLKTLVKALIALLLLPLAMVMALPALLLQVPAAAMDDVRQFYEVAKETGQQHGLEIPWEEVAAAWGTKEGDFTRAPRRRLREFAQNWIERHEHVVTTPEGEEIIIVTYVLRRFDAVMADMLRFSDEQKEQARTYKQAFKEGGNRAGAGWRATTSPWQAWPVPGHDTAASISSGFGLRMHPITRWPEHHTGVDIAAPEGTPVVAAWTGTVVQTGSDEELGLFIDILGQGKKAQYRHLSGIAVTVGQRVEAGQTIGLVGATGQATAPHLCFAVKVGGRWVDPLFYF